MSRIGLAAGADVREKWVRFDSTVHFKVEVPLARKIDLFVQPLWQFFENKYPQLLLGGTEIFWLTTFTAILESGMHPKEQVNAAIASRELQ